MAARDGETGRGPDAGGMMEWLEQESDLGHAQRTESFLRQVRLLSRSPGLTLGQMGRSAEGVPMAEIASLYRFVGNEAVSLDTLREVRARVVLRGMDPGEEYLVVHDPSCLDYTTHRAKGDRRALGNGYVHGYDYHPAVVVRRSDGAFMGTLHDTLVDRHGPDDAGQVDYAYAPALWPETRRAQRRVMANHKHQLAARIVALGERTAGRRLVHVSDREHDDQWVMDACRRVGQGFILRAKRSRWVQAPRTGGRGAWKTTHRGVAAREGWGWIRLNDLIGRLAYRPYKTVTLDEEGRLADAGQAGEEAVLEIAAGEVVLHPIAYRNGTYHRLPAAQALHLVVVREVAPPRTRDALVWVLWTSEPIDAPPAIEAVALAYERRGAIEGNFKLLKSGFQLEKARFHGREKIAKLLVLLTLAAQGVLAVQRQAGLPLDGRLDDESHARLRTAMASPNDPSVPLADRLAALILKRVGWLGRRSDRLGPRLWMRGILEVTAMFDGIDQYRLLLQEAKRHPEVLRRLICV